MPGSVKGSCIFYLRGRQDAKARNGIFADYDFKNIFFAPSLRLGVFVAMVRERLRIKKTRSKRSRFHDYIE
jgi:hypothetical protein